MTIVSGATMMEDAVVPVGVDEMLGSESEHDSFAVRNIEITPLKASIAESATLAKKLNGNGNVSRRSSVSRIGEGAPLSPLTPSFLMFGDEDCMAMIGEVTTPTTAAVVASLPLVGSELDDQCVGGVTDLLGEIENDSIKYGSAMLPPSSPVKDAEVPLAPVPSKPKRHATRAGGRKSPLVKRTSPTPAAGKSRRGGAGNKVSRAREASPLLPIKPGGVLPVNHKPARGRGRQQQLKSMTKQQIQAEAEARLEKNRLAARDCRLRRKYHLETLENQVHEYEQRFAEQERTIADLRAQLKVLQEQV